MNSDQMMKQLFNYRRDIALAHGLVKEILQLDKSRTENLVRIKARLDKLEAIVKSIDASSAMDELGKWVREYKSGVEKTIDEVRRTIGAELEGSLKSVGLRLSGQYPELRAGFFTIELDFDKWNATIWYGPKQERLSQCPLSPSAIAKQIENARKALGSGLKEAQLLEKLWTAYGRAVGEKLGQPVPIIKVLVELAYLLQKPRFYQDPRRENYIGYSRGDFSYDLFRIRKHQADGVFSSRLHLVVATRAHTRRRSDFLWVPDDETGKGTTYSHLKFEGVAK